ncbi:ricin-type beta-trefoil lectin domain protein [Photobacterium sp. DA100]|uniref:RICIN domain-containing protein n=1 Tax=Photobacterium sp. DA100 TaxID=3027472 RepID=UPI002478F7D7|nr:RICIN domain-containing protein [Photobacterium sp. DA100]WEM41549.1 ricin-type beta-trefoil lectin domain protein [Photobacterium sp. DA100]
MKKVSSSFFALSLLTAVGSACYASNLDQTDPVADLIQSSTAYFQQECHLYSPEKNVPSNCNYYVLNLAEISVDERRAFTSELLGLGVDSKYVLVTKPSDIDKRAIYLLDVLDPEYIASSLETELNKRSLSKRSVSQDSGNVMEFIVHRRFNVERQGKGNVTLKYKIRYYSKSPFYARSGDKDKYVEIILAEGSGVDMGLADSWSDIYRRWDHNSNTNYVYKEYLDAIDVGIKINDSVKLSSGQIYLNDLYPRMQDQVESKIEKETTTSIKVGLGFSPKIPIKDIEYSFSDKYSITNKKQFGLIAKTNKDGYNIKYVNNKYGSAVDPEHGFCDLGTADGWCWDYDERRGNPWNFDKLKQNNSLAVSGLRPDFIAKIAAKEGTGGTSDIVVKTTVDSLALFGHNRWIIGRRYASGSQLWNNSDSNSNWKTGRDFEKLTYSDQFTVTVDWNSPWFLGADAVTIKSTYLSQQNAQCLTVVGNSSLQFKDCVDGSKSQSFIYDQEKRYRSVANINQCLETANGQLTLSSDCRDDFARNTQIWYWQEPNGFTNDVLYTVNHDRTINAIDASSSVPGVLVLGDSEDKPDSVLYTSRFTDFSTIKP